MTDQGRHDQMPARADQLPLAARIRVYSAIAGADGKVVLTLDADDAANLADQLDSPPRALNVAESLAHKNTMLLANIEAHSQDMNRFVAKFRHTLFVAMILVTAIEFLF